MPPATRREVRLSASLPHPATQDGAPYTLGTSRSATFLMPDMELVLENYEQFRRKHLTQNREIIKQNTLHQLRIRELENRIQVLEDEKVQRELENAGLRGQLKQLRHAFDCIHAGWEAIGRGLTLSLDDPQSSSDFHYTSYITSQEPASRGVKIELNQNAASTRTPVAVAPAGNLERLEEELSEMVIDELAQQPLNAESPEAETCQDDWKPHFDAMRAAKVRTSSSSRSPATARPTSKLDLNDAPSPMGSPELPMELETAMAAAASHSASQSWSLPDAAPTRYVPKPSTPGVHEQGDYLARRSRRRSGRESSRRQSGYLSHSSHNGRRSRSQSPDILAAAPSSDAYDAVSLPSETNSDMMNGVLVYRGANEPPVDRCSSHEHPLTPFVDITNGTFASSYVEREMNSTHTTPRKSPGNTSLSHEAHQASTKDDLEPPTGRRARKSVNYALPKLNTKMRKPDHSDLVSTPRPGQRGSLHSALTSQTRTTYGKLDGARF